MFVKPPFWWKKAPGWKRSTEPFMISAWPWARFPRWIWLDSTWVGAFARNIVIWKSRAYGSRLQEIVFAKKAGLDRRPGRAGTNMTRIERLRLIRKWPRGSRNGRL